MNPKVEERLGATHLVWLTTVTPEGMPKPSLVWFWWDGESFLIYSRPAMVKLSNIEANPSVALNLDAMGRGVEEVTIIDGVAAVDLSAPPAVEHPEYLRQIPEPDRGRTGDHRRAIQRVLLGADTGHPDVDPGLVIMAIPLSLVRSETGVQTKIFFRTPIAAFFTLAFPLFFLVLINLLNSGATIDSMGGISIAQYTTPGIAVFGMVTATFTNLAINTANARDSGILKRVLSTPVSMPVHLAGKAAVCGARRPDLGGRHARRRSGPLRRSDAVGRPSRSRAPDGTGCSDFLRSWACRGRIVAQCQLGSGARQCLHPSSGLHLRDLFSPGGGARMAADRLPVSFPSSPSPARWWTSSIPPWIPRSRGARCRHDGDMAGPRRRRCDQVVLMGAEGRGKPARLGLNQPASVSLTPIEM